MHSAVIPARHRFQTRIGPAQDLGPGITGVRDNGITFELVAPAHVIVLRVTNSSGIEPVRPLRSADRSSLGRGEHVVTLASTPAATGAGGRTAAYGAEAYAGPVTRPPRDDVGYWLLIVSDAPTTAGDLSRRLAPMTFPDSSLLEVVRHLPQELVASRTTHWAAYYVAFGVTTTD